MGFWLNSSIVSECWAVKKPYTDTDTDIQNRTNSHYFFLSFSWDEHFRIRKDSVGIFNIADVFGCMRVWAYSLQLTEIIPPSYMTYSELHSTIWIVVVALRYQVALLFLVLIWYILAAFNINFNAIADLIKHFNVCWIQLNTDYTDVTRFEISFVVTWNKL